MPTINNYKISEEQKIKRYTALLNSIANIKSLSVDKQKYIRFTTKEMYTIYEFLKLFEKDKGISKTIKVVKIANINNLFNVWKIFEKGQH